MLKGGGITGKIGNFISFALKMALNYKSYAFPLISCGSDQVSSNNNFY
jgi:hypothetical protein